MRYFSLVGDSASLSGLIVRAAETGSAYRWKSIGQHAGTIATDTRCEGHAGFSYNLYETDAGSPFAAGIAAYVASVGLLPHELIWLLGINDCFAADPADPDPTIDTMLGHADTVQGLWTAAYPSVRQIVCTIPTPNSRDSVWTTDYPGGPTRAEWNTIRAQLNVRITAKWADVIVLDCDGTTGYDDAAGSAVHPNAAGAAALGACIAAGLTRIVGI